MVWECPAHPCCCYAQPTAYSALSVWEGERRGEDRGHKKRRERKEKEKEKTLREREREKERKRERDQWRVWQGGGDSQWDPICGVSMCGK